MINLVYLCLSVIVFVGVGKFALILYWTRRLHEKHWRLHTFSGLFRMMFGSHTASDMDPELWADFKPIQRWNFHSNTLLAGAAFVFFIAAIIWNRTR